MWILNIVPVTILYVLVLLSIALLVIAKFVPVPSLYIRSTAITILAVSLFFIGAHANQEHWQEKVAEAEKQVQQLQLEAEQLNTRLAAEQGKKRETIIKRQQQSIRFIEKEIIRYDKSCVIPREFIDVLNKSAERPQ